MMNTTDLLVLHALRNNSRIKHTVLARRHKWPVSTTHERVTRMIASCVERSVSMLDYARLGFTIHTLYVVKPTPGKKESWLAQIVDLPQLNLVNRSHSGEFIVESIVKTGHDHEIVRAHLSRGATIVNEFPILERIHEERIHTTAEYLPENGAATGNFPNAAGKQTKDN